MKNSQFTPGLLAKYEFLSWPFKKEKALQIAALFFLVPPIYGGVRVFIPYQSIFQRLRLGTAGSRLIHLRPGLG